MDEPPKRSPGFRPIVTVILILLILQGLLMGVSYVLDWLYPEEEQETVREYSLLQPTEQFESSLLWAGLLPPKSRCGRSPDRAADITSPATLHLSKQHLSFLTGLTGGNGRKKTACHFLHQPLAARIDTGQSLTFVWHGKTTKLPYSQILR